MRVSGLVTLAAILVFATAAEAGPIAVEVEGGYVFASVADVAIPGDTGTRFSVVDDLDPKGKFYSRLRVAANWRNRHTIYALYAPLELEASGQASADISFAGTLFPAGSDLEASYMFNSYRLTYRYLWKETDQYSLAIGATAKIRDAAITVNGNGTSAVDDNIGFVPLLSFRFEWNLSEEWTAIIDGDALAAPQGRAEDVLFALQTRIRDTGDLYAGYRIVEGGADNDTVYTFALFNYWTLGFRWQL